jgi:hypothetical protein
MTLAKCLLAGLLAAGLTLPAPVTAREHHRHRDRDKSTGAAVGLAIVGIAALAAANRKDRRDNRSYTIETIIAAIGAVLTKRPRMSSAIAASASAIAKATIRPSGPAANSATILTIGGIEP